MCDFSSSHVWMWELDCEEGWAPKNWCFRTMVLEKTLESPLDCKEIQPVHSEDQPWDFFGRNGAKAETPVLWPPHAKSWLIGKDSDAGRDWGQEEEGITWMRWLDGIMNLMDVSLNELREMVMYREAWHSVTHGVAKFLTWLSDWTEVQVFLSWYWFSVSPSPILEAAVCPVTRLLLLRSCVKFSVCSAFSPGRIEWFHTSFPFFIAKQP